MKLLLAGKRSFSIRAWSHASIYRHGTFSANMGISLHPIFPSSYWASWSKFRYQKVLDLLAAYPDYSARFYNYSGAAVVWEHPDTSLDSAIDQLLEASQQVVEQIGPWEEPRPDPPPRDSARLSFLTPSGLHFGQGPLNALGQDPLGGRVLNLASDLMRALTAKTNNG